MSLDGVLPCLQFHPKGAGPVAAPETACVGPVDQPYATPSSLSNVKKAPGARGGSGGGEGGEVSMDEPHTLKPCLVTEPSDRHSRRSPARTRRPVGLAEEYSVPPIFRWSQKFSTSHSTALSVIGAIARMVHASLFS